MQDTTSSFNADLSLKFTPTEKLPQSTNTVEIQDRGEIDPGKNPSKLSAKGSLGFTYFKNETYALFLSHSSKKVRPYTSYTEHNGIHFQTN